MTAGWPRVVLADVADIRGGGKLKLSGKDFVDDGFPAYGAGGFNGLVPVAEHEQRGIVLASVGTCGRCYLTEAKWTSLANTHVILPHKDVVDLRFMWYQLDNPARWPLSGTAQPFIKPADVKTHRVLLPPIQEQRRIASVLDAADALRAKRRQALSRLDTLTQATFIGMFRDGRTFESMRLEKLASKERYSLASGPFGSNLTSKHYVEDGVLVLRGLNISSGELNLNNCKYVSVAKAEELERSAIRPNDVVIVAVGSSGQAFLIPEDFPRAVLSQNFNKISPDEQQVDPVYLVWALNSPIVQRQFSRNITDTVRTFLSLTKIKKVELPVPPLGIQRRFAAIVESVEQQKASQRSHLDHLDNLFASLQQRAFRGEL